MKKTKIFGALAAAVVVLAAAQPVFAASVPGNGANTTTVGTPTEKEIAANGETTVGIMEARMDPSNISFEVPLYVTVAAVKNQQGLAAPTNYKITNTSTAPVGDTAYDIAVTGMSFQRVANATWNTKGSNGATAFPTLQASELYLTIGGVEMPETKDSTTEQAVDLTKSAMKPTYTGNPTIPGTAFAGNLLNNAFYTAGTVAGQAGTYTAIKPSTSLALPIYGQVGGTVTADKAATPQFKVKYVVSAVGADGKILGNVYAGDNSVAAGLGTWDDTTNTFLETKATAK